MLYQLSYVGDRTRMRLKTPTSVDTQRALALSLERETGFEPATPSLEGSCSSQLSYSRSELSTTHSVRTLYHHTSCRNGGEGRIRTSEGMIQQIYSLPRLAASVPLPRYFARYFLSRLKISNISPIPAALISTGTSILLRSIALNLKRKTPAPNRRIYRFSG